MDNDVPACPLTDARQARAQLERYTRGCGKHAEHYQALVDAHHPGVGWIKELHDMWYTHPECPFMMGHEAILARGIGAGVNVSLTKQVARELSLHHGIINRVLQKMVADAHMVLGDTEHWYELSLEYEGARLAMEMELEQAMTQVIEHVPKFERLLSPLKERHVTTKQSIIQALKLNLSQLSSSSSPATSPHLSSSDTICQSSSSTTIVSENAKLSTSPQKCIATLLKQNRRSVPVSPRDQDRVHYRKKRISLPPGTTGQTGTPTRVVTYENKSL